MRHERAVEIEPNKRLSVNSRTVAIIPNPQNFSTLTSGPLSQTIGFE